MDRPADRRLVALDQFRGSGLITSADAADEFLKRRGFGHGSAPHGEMNEQHFTCWE
jgi:hypothetical protein